MKVFISWSDDTKGVAQAINRTLPSLFDNSDPWISTENPSGSMWMPQIDEQLSDTDFGIVCVSKKNQHKPWLNYEAGALSRKVGAKRQLMPVLLIDFDAMNQVTGPMSGFQMKMATAEGFYEVMRDLNSSELGPNIREEILKSRAEIAWKDIEKEVEAVRAGDSDNQPAEADRSDSEKIDELLSTVRDIAKSMPSSRSGGLSSEHRETSLAQLLEDARMIISPAEKLVGEVNRWLAKTNVRNVSAHTYDAGAVDIFSSDRLEPEMRKHILHFCRSKPGLQHVSIRFSDSSLESTEWL